MYLCVLVRHLGLNSEMFPPPHPTPPKKRKRKKKKVKHAVFSLYKPWEMASCVYEGGMRSDVSGLPHSSSESAQVSAHAAGCCSACQIRNWTCASYSSTISWSGLSCGENIQLNTTAWRYYTARTVAFTSLGAICNEAVCWQAVLGFRSLGHVEQSPSTFPPLCLIMFFCLINCTLDVGADWILLVTFTAGYL